MQIRNLAQRMALAAGGAADAQVIVVSIDPLDTPALADTAKHKFLDDLLPAARADRWHFLSGAPAEIAQLAQSLGFSYGYDAGDATVCPSGGLCADHGGRQDRALFLRLRLYGRGLERRLR